MVEAPYRVVDLHKVDLAQLRAIARRFARALRPGDLVFLVGALGTGKTTFVRAIAQALGVADSVRSPSFTLANIYEGRIGRQRVAVQHLDLYRLNEVGEDDALALEEYPRGEAITLVEWPETGRERLGEPTWVVELGHESLHERSLVITATVAEARDRWKKALGRSRKDAQDACEGGVSDQEESDAR